MPRPLLLTVDRTVPFARAFAQLAQVWNRIPASLVLVALVVTAYFPVLSAGYVWDDDVHVTANSTLRTADGLRQIWCHLGALPQYYPLVHTTFWCEYHLWGLSPLGYHVTNLILHAASAVLLARVLSALRVSGALWAGALFAVHPVEVESVAWISERKNVLSLILALSALLAYVRCAQLDECEPARTPAVRWRWYALALVLFVAALLSKTVVVSLPAVMLLIIWWRRGQITWRECAALAPFFLVGLTLGLVTVWMERHVVGALGRDWALSAGERVLLAAQNIWFYAAKLAWPRSLVFIYSRSAVDTGAGSSYAFSLACLAVIAALWCARHRVGRGTLAAVLIYLVVLFPALGFFNVYPFRFSYVADHFQYHASASLMALVATGAAQLLLRASSLQRAAGQGAVVATVGILMLLTWRQAAIYRDEETLYRDTIAKNPAAWMAYANLGVYCDNRGRLDEALALYRTAVDLCPDDAAHRINLGGMLLKLGGRDGFATGQLDEALAHLRLALELQPWRPEVHERLGQALLLAGDAGEAIRHYREALRLRPEYADVHNDLAVALSRQGQLDEAVQHFEEAAALAPENVDMGTNLAMAYAQAENYAGAVRCAERTLELAVDQGRADKVRLLETWLRSRRGSSTLR